MPFVFIYLRRRCDVTFRRAPVSALGILTTNSTQLVILRPIVSPGFRRVLRNHRGVAVSFNLHDVAKSLKVSTFSNALAGFCAIY